MKKIMKAEEIMECWNLKYPDNPCTLEEIKDSLKWIIFIGSSPQFAVEYLKSCGFKSTR